MGAIYPIVQGIRAENPEGPSQRRGFCHATHLAIGTMAQGYFGSGIVRQARAGRQSRPTLPKALSITGQNRRTIASVVIEPTRPFDQKTFISPPEPIIDRRNASSARLPSTSASVNGASGMPIFLKT